MTTQALYLDPEWKALDFQKDVRPAQLSKLQNHMEQIAQIGQQLQANNEQNLAQIDLAYKDTAEVEHQFIDKKMENMNLINDSEMEGIKFLQQFGECTRESESFNQQINQIQHVIAMLQNELASATVEEGNMNEVYDQEQQLVYQKELMINDDEDQVQIDMKDQSKTIESQLQEMEGVQTKQHHIHKTLSTKQQQVVDKLEKQSADLENQREKLRNEKEQLQGQVRDAKKDNQIKQNKNRKLEGEIAQLEAKIDVMEDNLTKIVFENVEQFEHYQDIVHENNVNINSIRTDLGSVQKQHYEMLNINESLEQRIDQLKGQRDLSIVLSKAGLENDLKSQQVESQTTNQKLISLLNNTEMTWEDQLIVKMRELDDAMRQSSEQSINKQVNKYLQNVRDKNRKIVEVTRDKEEIESKMKNEVNDQLLKDLQKKHSELIQEYEQIIKDKIDIFSEMIVNLNGLSDGNYEAINNEEKIAQEKLSIEIWDRDIYQKKRVNMDIAMEIQGVLGQIDKQNNKIKQRQERIQELEKELEDAEAEYADFQDDYNAREQRIQELHQQIQILKEEKARLEAEEEEKRRLEDELRKNRPKPRVRYVSIKGDKVDEKMAHYINNFELDVPMQRLGDGQYMFGSRKIFAKIMNDKLVIRVGGGFMLIDEFLPTYGQQELEKLEGGNLQTQASQPSKGSFTGAMTSPARKGSPTAGAMWGKVGGRASPTANNRQSPTANRMKF